jgi:flagellar hook-length control protein FliK
MSPIPTAADVRLIPAQAAQTAHAAQPAQPAQSADSMPQDAKALPFFAHLLSKQIGVHGAAIEEKTNKDPKAATAKSVETETSTPADAPASPQAPPIALPWMWAAPHDPAAAATTATAATATANAATATASGKRDALAPAATAAQTDSTSAAAEEKQDPRQGIAPLPVHAAVSATPDAGTDSKSDAAIVTPTQSPAVSVSRQENLATALATATAAATGSQPRHDTDAGDAAIGALSTPEAPAVPTTIAANTPPATPMTPPAQAAAPEIVIESRIGTPRWTRDLHDSVTMLVHSRTSVAELHLTPADMGPVDIRIDFSGTQPSVSISVQHADTRNALDAALPRLQDMLAESGITLGGASVEQRGERARDGGGDRQTPRQDGPGGDAAVAAVGESAPVTRTLSLDQLVDTYA